MKIVIAPDSFKGSLSSTRFAALVEAAALERFPAASVVKISIADGGEGTLDALLMAVGGEKRRARVAGPDGKPLWAEYARLSDGSFAIELAQCAALPQMRPLNPMRATTLGVGQLMRAALCPRTAEAQPRRRPSTYIFSRFQRVVKKAPSTKEDLERERGLKSSFCALVDKNRMRSERNT